MELLKIAMIEAGLVLKIIIIYRVYDFLSDSFSRMVNGALQLMWK